MKIAVLINNFNYERFAVECIKSLSTQSRKPDQIIFIDDGSTDGSLNAVNSFSNHGFIDFKVITKANGGQLSSFNAAFEELNDDIDLVCFLDSDDKYDLGYLENLEKIASEAPRTEVFYSSYKFLYADESTKSVIFQSNEMPPQLLQTIFGNRFNGVPTSMISFRRKALARILPHPDESSWRIRADDVLVYLSSAMLMNRRYVSEPLVLYRIHGSNQFHGKKLNPHDETNRIFALARLLQPIREKFNDLTLAEKRKIVHFEFSSEKPSIKSCIRFLGILFNMKLPILQIPGFIYAFAKSSISGIMK